jgi:hypothetical protein
MGRKGKYSAEEKLKIVEDCINGRDMDCSQENRHKNGKNVC